MKVRFLLFSFLSLCFLSCSKLENESAKDKTHSFINEIQSKAQEIIPDSRVGVRDIDLRVDNDSIIGEVRSDNSTLLREVSNLIEGSDFRQNVQFTKLPSEELGEDTFAIVNNSVANIRTSPKHSGELSTQALLGTPVRVLDRTAEWFRVQTPDQYIAWVDDDGIHRMNSDEFTSWQNMKKLIITAYNASAYKSPEGNTIISDLVYGAILPHVKSESEFAKIQFPDGRTGWVHTSNTKPAVEWETKNLNYNVMLKRAQSLMGRPYMWGGTSVRAMDCSGFTKTLIREQGFIIPRDASQQVHSGKKVNVDDSLSQLQPGDFIFFGNKREDGSDRITHVAMYTGDGGIIHASGRVKKENLLPGHKNFNAKRYETIMHVRRFIGYENMLQSIKNSIYYAK